MSYKIHFKRNFAALLREAFGDDPLEIAKYFGCSHQQALNYLNEISAPGGEKATKIIYDKRFAAVAKKYLNKAG